MMQYDNKIIEYERNETTRNFIFDPVTEKCYWGYCKDEWLRKGHFLEIQQQRFNTHSVNTFSALGAIIKVGDKATLPYGTFKFFNQQNYHKDYWKTFIPPINTNKAFN